MELDEIRSRLLRLDTACVCDANKSLRVMDPEIRPVRRYHDLDGLAGSWSKQEAEAFEKTLAQPRAIDPEMWK